MLAGEPINHTEEPRRPPHGPARRQAGTARSARRARTHAANSARSIHSGKWRGFAGERITDIVNIGIGGSDLGPRMAVRPWPPAAAGYQGPFHRQCRWRRHRPAARPAQSAHTLFIIASKTFTTLETLTNARTARAWLLATAGRSAVAQHFVADLDQSRADTQVRHCPDNVFEFWDWVGGRFSLWSAIGLRWRWPSAGAISSSCWPAPAPWISISSRPRPRPTCR
jgi:glucose-6-phosphate isomerase